MACIVACCAPAYARTSYDTLKDEDNNVSYSISYEDYLYDGTGSYFMASISSKENITARKGQSPSGKVFFLLRCRAKDDRHVYAELSWGGADTDCTKKYTASFKSTYDHVNVPVTITREATSGHTWGSTWSMVSGSSTKHERSCTHPVCVQKDTCEAAWTSCTSNGNGTHTFTCEEGHTVTTPCSGGEATCVAKAVCKDCHEEYGSINPDNHKEKTAATCVAKATCELCGNEYGCVNPENHLPGEEATCTTDQVCTRVGCGKVLVDALGHDESGAEATCTTDKVCNREGCDHVLVEALGHDESGAEATCTTDKVCNREGCDYVLAERLGHDESGAEATCTTDKVCAREGCDHVLVEALGHDESGAEATCTTDKVCAREGCDYVLAERLGHDETGADATCTTDKVCNREGCDYVLVERLGHDESGAEATCTTDKVCNREGCDHVLVEALGHDESGAEATCTTDKVCAREGCDYVLVERLGHDESGAEATCTTDKVCNREGCDYVLVERLGHDESGAEATCTTDKVCAREGCDHVLVEALGHDETGADATCTTDKVCAREGCDHVLVKALGHELEETKKVAATCTEKGYIDYICTREGCGETVHKELKAKRHWYDLWTSNEDGTHSAACKRENCKHIGKAECALWEVTETKDDIATILTVCPVCGDFDEKTFEVIAEAKIDCEKLPMGEAIVRGMEAPFEGALYAFTAGYEYSGKMQAFENVKDEEILPITISLPLSEEIGEFTLVRVDVTPATEETERAEVWTELAYTFEDGVLTFETETDGLFLLLPVTTEEA